MPNDVRSVDEPSVLSLVGGIINDAQELIRQQFALLRREVQQELHQAKNAAISFALGTAIAAVGALLLIVMVVQLLDYYTDIPLWGCYAIVGGVLAAVGGGLLYLGKREAANVELAPPPQTAEALKENFQWLREQTTKPNRT